MAIIPWKPFGDFDKFFEDDDWVMPMLPKIKTPEPAMDVYETDKEVVAKVSLPDIDPEKVGISVKNGVLRVSGRSEEEKEEKNKGYWRKEIRKGAFERMVRLPAPVKEDKVDAVYERGTLRITMPKTEEKKSEKKIKIKTKGA